MQMLIHSQEEKSNVPTPEATPVRVASTGAASLRLCKCGKTAEKLRVKAADNPRKGREFWKCVQRQCDFFEWEPMLKNEEETRTVTGSQRSRHSKSPLRTPGTHSPRRGKSPRRTEDSWSQVPPMPGTAQTGSQVPIVDLSSD